MTNDSTDDSRGAPTGWDRIFYGTNQSPDPDGTEDENSPISIFELMGDTREDLPQSTSIVTQEQLERVITVIAPRLTHIDKALGELQLAYGDLHETQSGYASFYSTLRSELLEEQRSLRQELFDLG